MSAMKKCPKCGSRKVAPILYGMPVFDEEMERQLNNQELYLGGCCMEETAPEYHCFGCGKNVGSPPIFLSRRGEEDYREVVTAIRFNRIEARGGDDQVYIKRMPDGRILSDYRPAFQKALLPVRRELTEKEWSKLLDRLFCKLYVHEWAKSYQATKEDGEEWELEIRLTNRRVRNYRGENAYPPYWNELISSFKPLLQETTIERKEGKAHG